MYTSNNAWSYNESLNRTNSHRHHRYGSCLPKNVRKSILIVTFLTLAISTMVITIERMKTDVPESSQTITGPFIVNTIILKLITSSTLCFLYGFFWEECQEMNAAILSFVPIVTFVIIDYVVNVTNAVNGKSNRNQLDTARLYIVAIGTPIFAALSKWATSTFRCRRIVGAGDILLNMYITRCRLQSYMRLDLQVLILLGLLGFGIEASAKHSTSKYIVVGVMITFAILKWIIGKVAIEKESKGMVAVFVSLSTLGNLWIPIQLILVSCFDTQKCPTSQVEYSFATLAAAIFVILSQVHIYISLMKVYRNFGYGLTDTGKCIKVSKTTSSTSNSSIKFQASFDL